MQRQTEISQLLVNILRSPTRLWLGQGKTGVEKSVHVYNMGELTQVLGPSPTASWSWDLSPGSWVWSQALLSQMPASTDTCTAVYALCTKEFYWHSLHQMCLNQRGENWCSCVVSILSLLGLVSCDTIMHCHAFALSPLIQLPWKWQQAGIGGIF